MPKNPDAWKLMEPHFIRVKWNWRHIFDLDEESPYKPPRNGMKDLFHSIVNLGPELARIDPWRAGHYLFYLVAGVAVLVTVIVVW